MTGTAFKCTNCGAELAEENAHSFADVIYCEECLDEETFICDRCGERHSSENQYGDDNTSLCETCYYAHYVHCVTCGRLLGNYDAYYLESDGYEEHPYCYY